MFLTPLLNSNIVFLLISSFRIIILFSVLVHCNRTFIPFMEDTVGNHVAEYTVNVASFVSINLNRREARLGEEQLNKS